jgi:hypothetical protein
MLGINMLASSKLLKNKKRDTKLKWKKYTKLRVKW